jgi:D-alanine-D-alanine ligase
MGKRRVAVVMGGPSSERDVSLRSGQAVLAHLDPQYFDAYAIELNDWLQAPEALCTLKQRADFVFLALHGQWGEDGRIQGLLDFLGIPYYGSGVLGSALALNKARAKSVYRDLGMLQAPGYDFRCVVGVGWFAGVTSAAALGDQPLEKKVIEAFIAERLGWDLIVKGVSQGSTLGLGVVESPATFWPVMESVAGMDDEILVERRIRGIEVTAGVIGTYPLQALPLVAITPQIGDLFDYTAKYTPGASLEVCPAPLSPELAQAVQELALRAHRGLGCHAISRSDFILNGDGIYILETNTLPGLTEQSLIPLAARTAGIAFGDLLTRLIDASTQRMGA